MITAKAIVETLRARGERLTIQRRMVINALCAHGEHLSVHAIQHQLTHEGVEINETTVYRILQWLKDQELVSQTDLGHSGVVYQIIGREPHHHLVCLNCGAVIDIDDSVMEPLRARLRNEFDFEPRIEHMAFFGVCGACRDDSTP